MLDLDRLRGGLIVSCQAAPDSPLDSATAMTDMALAAVMGGAVGIRANGVGHVRAIREAVTVPVIGLRKRRLPGIAVYITPTIEDARAIADAGADLVAVDATLRPRPDGTSTAAMIAVLAREGIAVLADVDGLEAGLAAADAGAVAIATTLSGYTQLTSPTGPDIELVRRLVAASSLPVIAEGRYRRPEDVRAAFEAGATAVVVGQAITDPVALTRRLVEATPNVRTA
ncbi:MAG: N-acetylmannosamine-6-phosphate 2-epimerase [Chloroflexi bacterium]|nr:N-acetylmannosamine-6-phosphate 2-epimerase [Chloroflexota bacterium]